MQPQGNPGRKLDASQLQKVQQSIKLYQSQGLGNDPRCRTLENVLREHYVSHATTRQPAQTLGRPSNVGRTPQISLGNNSFGASQQLPYTQDVLTSQPMTRGVDLSSSLFSNNQSGAGVGSSTNGMRSRTGFPQESLAPMVSTQNQLSVFGNNSQEQARQQQLQQRLRQLQQQNSDFQNSLSGFSGAKTDFDPSRNAIQNMNSSVPSGNMLNLSQAQVQRQFSVSGNFPVTNQASQRAPFSQQGLVSHMSPSNPQFRLPQVPNFGISGSTQSVFPPSKIQTMAAFSSSNQNGSLNSSDKLTGQGATVSKSFSVPNRPSTLNNFVDAQVRALNHINQIRSPPPETRPPAKPASRPGYGFTKQQLAVLKSQIIAIKHFKRGEKSLPPDLLAAVIPPPLPESLLVTQKIIPEQAQPQSSAFVVKNSPQRVVGTGMPSSSPSGIMPPINLNSSVKLGGSHQLQPPGMPGPYSQGLRATGMGKSEEERKLEKAEERRRRRKELRDAKVAATKSHDEAYVDSFKKPVIPAVFSSSGGSTLGSQYLNNPSLGSTFHRLIDVNVRPKEETSVRKPVNIKGPFFQPILEEEDEEMPASNFAVVEEVGYDVRELIADEMNKTLEVCIKDKLAEVDRMLEGKLMDEGVKKLDQRIKLRIQQKMLNLAALQAKVRRAVEEEQSEICEMGDRAYRTFLRQCERQRNEIEKQTRMALKAHRERFLKAISTQRKKFLESQWGSRDVRNARNRAVLKQHERLLREYAKKKDENRFKRMEALKNNDVEAYREMLEKQQTEMKPDDSRVEGYEKLASFLSKTEDYLKKLGGKISAVKNQQEIEESVQSAMADARAQGLSEEEIREAGEEALEESRRSMWSEDQGTSSGAAAVSKYYAVAHTVTEKLTKQPSMLKFGVLREYQMVGLQWMLSLYNNRLNGILADEMGLGKTVQVMALIAHLMESKGNYGPHLIIVPNAVMVNWKSELTRWLPSVNCVYYVGNRDQRTKIYNQEMAAQTFNVLVTTYEFIMRDRAKLSKVEWKYLIIDEAQRMKDRESRLSRDLDRFRCQRRLLLTGTPLQNDLHELWSLLNLLLPEVFDSSKIFLDWFDKPFNQGKNDASLEEDELETEKKVVVIHRLHQILEPFMLRRRVEDVEGCLPPKVPVVIRCKMSSYQSAVYDWVKATGTIKVDPELESQRVANSNRQVRTFAPLQNKCMELKKICNHPFLSHQPRDFLPPEAIVRTCGKLFLLDRILVKLKRTGHKVLLFSTMTKLLDILEDYLEWRGLKFRRIDGTTPLDDRESAIVDFNKPDSECFIFLLSIRAAGRGLNLQSADTVIIYDPDPNPKNEEQAVARAHRIGQKREVKVIYFESVVECKPFFKREDEEKSKRLKREWEKVDKKLRKMEGKGIPKDSEKGLSLQARLEKVSRKLADLEAENGSDEEEGFDGAEPFVGSIETLIRHNIQQHKIEMADEVINAGRFDQLTTQEERKQTLEEMLRDEDRYQQRVHAVPSMEEINKLISRSEAEAELFDQMDREMQWPDLMDSRSDVPAWLRSGSKEVRRAQATTAKPALRGAKKSKMQVLEEAEALAMAEKEPILGRGLRNINKEKRSYFEAIEVDKQAEEMSEKSSDEEAMAAAVAVVDSHPKKARKVRAVEAMVAKSEEQKGEEFGLQNDDIEEIFASMKGGGNEDVFTALGFGESEEEEEEISPDLGSGQGRSVAAEKAAMAEMEEDKSAENSFENGSENNEWAEEEEEEYEEGEIKEDDEEYFGNREGEEYEEGEIKETSGEGGLEEVEEAGQLRDSFEEGEDGEVALPREGNHGGPLSVEEKSSRVDLILQGLSGNKRKRSSRGKGSSSMKSPKEEGELSD